MHVINEGSQNVPPARAPDAVVEEKIPENQTLLYRLSGDVNPLHVDGNFARAFGFQKPILHGLCTFGYAGHHVIESFAKGEPGLFRSIKVRFSESGWAASRSLSRPATSQRFVSESSRLENAGGRPRKGGRGAVAMFWRTSRSASSTTWESPTD